MRRRDRFNLDATVALAVTFMLFGFAKGAVSNAMSKQQWSDRVTGQVLTYGGDVSVNVHASGHHPQVSASGSIALHLCKNGRFIRVNNGSVSVMGIQAGGVNRETGHWKFGKQLSGHTVQLVLFDVRSDDEKGDNETLELSVNSGNLSLDDVPVQKKPSSLCK